MVGFYVLPSECIEFLLLHRFAVLLGGNPKATGKGVIKSRSVGKTNVVADVIDRQS